MKTKTLSLSILLVAVILLTACGPSAEQIATMTASAWTPTPRPTATPTITPSPTPVPYDLTVKVVDADGNPITGASVVFPESGNGEPVAADDAGQAAWSNLNGPNVSVTVTAQGYLKGEQGAALERGPNEIIVKLERDPFGLLPSTACAAGESLLYMEDFQDGQTDMAHNEDGGAPVPFSPAVDEAGNTVLIHDFATPVGDYSSYLTRGADGSPITFGDAVWRMRFMITKETDWGLGWQGAGPTEFGGITTSGSSYGIYFNTGRHTGMTRSIWDASGQPVPDAGLGFVDKVLILKTNTWLYIEISSYQGHLQVWLDGVFAVDAVDPTPLPPGGFDIGRGNAGIMYFDAISVCGLSAPFVSMSSPVPVVTP